MHECEKNARVGVERTGSKRKKPLDRLTRDVLAAEAAGMSYGKYKATHPYTPEEDDEEEEEVPNPDEVLCTCVNCGQPFVKLKSRTNKLFCSTPCQLQYNNKKRYDAMKSARPEKPTACRVCGKIFLADYQHRIYCSTECYRKGQTAREAERRRLKKLEEKKND